MEAPINETKKALESFLVSWNVRFRYDRLWRQKYNIPFGSQQHLEMDQISIFLDIQEDILTQRIRDADQKKKEDLEDYRKTGKLFKENTLSSEEEDRIFKKIKIRSQ